jgi:hypothetical protein
LDLDRLNPNARRWAGNMLLRRGDGTIPCHAGIDQLAWDAGLDRHRDRLAAVAARCPNVAFGMPGGTGRKSRETVTDRWGCVWLYNEVANDGQCIRAPLADWSAWPSYRMPDPDDYHDWGALRADMQKRRSQGELTSVGVEHGFLFLRLTYLRGFQGLLEDIADESDAVLELLDNMGTFWVRVAERMADLQPDFVGFPDDLGMQHSLPMSPASWRKLLKPIYTRIFRVVREAGATVHMHTDGFIVDIIPDLIDCGVGILNPQDLVNGLDSLERLAKGRVSLDLDIDRQSVTVFGSPEQVRCHIAECAERLGSPTGGLSMIYGAYGGTPVENVEAVLLGMQENHDRWVGVGR